MLKNYFKIAWRNLIKNKVYSFINIGGLAVGMRHRLANPYNWGLSSPIITEAILST